MVDEKGERAEGGAGIGGWGHFRERQYRQVPTAFSRRAEPRFARPRGAELHTHFHGAVHCAGSTSSHFHRPHPNRQPTAKPMGSE